MRTCEFVLTQSSVTQRDLCATKRYLTRENEYHEGREEQYLLEEDGDVTRCMELRFFLEWVTEVRSSGHLCALVIDISSEYDIQRCNNDCNNLQCGYDCGGN